MNFELTEEQIDIKAAVREFCEKEFTKEKAMKYDRREEFPRGLHGKAAKLGFVGIHFPEEYGGQGYGYLENVLVAEEMCKADSTLSTPIIPGDLGCELIMRHGTEEQKMEYLPRVAGGDAISATSVRHARRDAGI